MTILQSRAVTLLDGVFVGPETGAFVGVMYRFVREMAWHLKVHSWWQMSDRQDFFLWRIVWHFRAALPVEAHDVVEHARERVKPEGSRFKALDVPLEQSN